MSSCFKLNRTLALIVLGLSSQTYADENKSLEIIEVTAQKRTENIQEVPIAITAFSEAELKKLGVTNVNDLGVLTPGLETNNPSATQTEFNIRGISTNDSGIGVDPAVAVYIDGVYVGRRGTANLSFNDVERVEVLKGPQGTLFGRNSAAGAIHIITKNPTSDYESAVKLTLGDYDKRKLELSTNAEIAPDVNFRGSFISNHRDGYLKIKGSDEKYYDNQDWSLRGALGWVISPDLELYVRGDYSELNQQARPVFSLNTGISTGDPFGPLEIDYFGKEKRDVGGVSAELVLSKDEYTFTSITSYRQFERYNSMDNDGSAYYRAFYANTVVEDQWQASQEFRINFSSEKLKWTAGANFFYEDINQESHTYFNTITFDALGWASQGNDPRVLPNIPAGIGTGYFLGYLVSVESPATIGALMANGLNFDQISYVLGQANMDKEHREVVYNGGKNASAAIYFDGTYSITEQLNVTLGARYTYDDKELSIDSQRTNFVDIPFDGFEPVAIWAAFSPQDSVQEQSWDEFTPRIVVDYKIDNNVMAYASYTEGFKSGGFNTFNKETPVKEETVKNTEVGIKSGWFEDRLRVNFSAYQFDYNDFQLLELYGQPIPMYRLRNVDAEGNGWELDASWRATDDLTFAFNYGTTDTEYTKWNFFDENEDRNSSKVGEPISGMPKHQGSARIDYYLDGLDGVFNFHLNYVYTKERQLGFIGNLAIMPFEQGSVTGLEDTPEHNVEGYGLLNTRINWESNEYPIFVGMYINNVIDEEYILAPSSLGMVIGSPAVTPGLPRMVGLEFGMRFN